jgi:hypothetical protein
MELTQTVGEGHRPNEPPGVFLRARISSASVISLAQEVMVLSLPLKCNRFTFIGASALLFGRVRTVVR